MRRPSPAQVCEQYILPFGPDLSLPILRPQVAQLRMMIFASCLQRTEQYFLLVVNRRQIAHG